MAEIAARTGWRRILYTVGIVLGLGLLAQQAWQGYLALHQAQTCVVRPSFLLVTLGLYILAYFVQMAAWAFIMRSLNAPLTPKAVVEGYALSFLPRYIPGSVWGYLSRNEWLLHNHGVPYGVSTTASLIEAALLLISATILGTLYWLPTWLPQIQSSPFIMLALAAIGILASWLVWQMIPWLATRFAHKSVQMDWERQQSLGLWSVTSFLYLLFWFIQGSALLTIAQTLCGGLPLGLYPATAASGLAWAIGFLIIFVPAGLGVREWTLGTLLVTFAALQPGQATLLAVVSRFGMIVAELLVLLIGLQTQIKRWWQRQDWVANDGSRK